MKISFLIICVSLIACTKQNAIPTTVLMEPFDTTNSMSKKGDFNNGPYGMVSGKAILLVNNNQKSLVLENISSSNGPDLHVYLSKEVQPINFIDLGRLKSVNGTQVYPVESNINFQDYKFVLIHCQQFNHLFGSANIQ